MTETPNKSEDDDPESGKTGRPLTGDEEAERNRFLEKFRELERKLLAKSKKTKPPQ